MAYAPDQLNQPPYVDPLHDPASETSPPYTPSPESLAAAEQAEARAKAGARLPSEPAPGSRPSEAFPATSYDYSGGKASV